MKYLPSALMCGLILSACGGKKKETIITNPPMRQGEKLGQVDLKWVDVEPVLSADGQKLVFISGREGTTRVYFKNLTQSEAAVRITNGDEAESHPSINADGSLISFFRSESGVLKLWVQSTADANRKVEVKASEGSSILSRTAHFSPTDALLLYFEKDASGIVKQQVAKLTDTGTEITASTPAAFSFGEGEIAWAQWWRLNSGFAAVAVKTDGTPEFRRVGFTSETLSDAALTTWGAGKLERLTSSIFNGFGDNLAFVQKLTAREKEIEPYGDQTGEEKVKVQVQNRLRLLNTAGDIADLETTQFEVLDAQGTEDGKYLLVLGYEYLACKFRGVYGATIVVHDLVAKTQQRLFLTQDGSKQWKLVTDACSLFTEETPKENKMLDLYTLHFSLASKTVNGGLRVAVETFYSGDPEIRVFDLSGPVGSLSATAVEVSNNEIQK